MMWGMFGTHWTPRPQPVWQLLLTECIPLWWKCTHLMDCFQQYNAPWNKASHLVPWIWQWVWRVLQWDFNGLSSLNPIQSHCNGVEEMCSITVQLIYCSCRNYLMQSCQHGTESLQIVSRTFLSILAVLRAKGDVQLRFIMVSPQYFPYEYESTTNTYFIP